jgi:hypothetical protein
LDGRLIGRTDRFSDGDSDGGLDVNKENNSGAGVFGALIIGGKNIVNSGGVFVGVTVIGACVVGLNGVDGSIGSGIGATFDAKQVVGGLADNVHIPCEMKSETALTRV